MRNYNQEYQDNDRKYAYDFDSILRNYMMKTFENFFPNGKALEMGCYKGDVTILLKNYFDDLTVIEASDELISETKQRVGNDIQFIHSTFETAEIKEKYDAIFLIHTLEHLDQPVLVLEQIKSWLSDKGLLFLAVPNATAPSRQIAVKMGLISHNSAVTPAEYEHGHRNTYSFDTLEREAKQSGLNIKHSGGVFFKGLANFQIDKALNEGIITPEYLDGCFELGMQYPELCASIYLVCGKE